MNTNQENHQMEFHEMHKKRMQLVFTELSDIMNQPYMKIGENFERSTDSNDFMTNEEIQLRRLMGNFKKKEFEKQQELNTLSENYKMEHAQLLQLRGEFKKAQLENEKATQQRIEISKLNQMIDVLNFKLANTKQAELETVIEELRHQYQQAQSELVVSKEKEEQAQAKLAKLERTGSDRRAGKGAYSQYRSADQDQRKRTQSQMMQLHQSQENEEILHAKVAALELKYSEAEASKNAAHERLERQEHKVRDLERQLREANQQCEDNEVFKLQKELRKCHENEEFLLAKVEHLGRVGSEGKGTKGTGNQLRNLQIELNRMQMQLRVSRENEALLQSKLTALERKCKEDDSVINEMGARDLNNMRAVMVQLRTDLRLSRENEELLRTKLSSLERKCRDEEAARIEAKQLNEDGQSGSAQSQIVQLESALSQSQAKEQQLLAELSSLERACNEERLLVRELEQKIAQERDLNRQGQTQLETMEAELQEKDMNEIALQDKLAAKARECVAAEEAPSEAHDYSKQLLALRRDLEQRNDVAVSIFQQLTQINICCEQQPGCSGLNSELSERMIQSEVDKPDCVDRDMRVTGGGAPKESIGPHCEEPRGDS